MALSEILDSKTIDYMKDEHAGFKGCLKINASVPGDGLMKITSDENHTFDVKFLPPLELNFSLPLDYPSGLGPEFYINCVWLLDKQKKELEEELRKIWAQHRGEVILFIWYNFLRDDIFQFLDMENLINICDIDKHKPPGNE